ncbi:MAG: MoxR family ATPase [Archaeoglobaceae archaeon]
MREILDEVSKFVVGLEDVKLVSAIALLSEGHVLIQGFPGSGKTIFAKNFAKAIGCDFKRIQMTPDLLPSDVIGGYYYDLQSGKWILRKGPIFSNVLLVDELNRATPRTQAALLEAMQERQVTIEGETFKLPRPFLVIATQTFGEGTYPLPEVIVDRFAFSVETNYLGKKEEIEVLSRIDFIDEKISGEILSAEKVLEKIEKAKAVFVSESVKSYIVDLVNALRKRREILNPISTRASVSLLKGSRALAFLEGRDYVIPDDVKRVAIFALAHRIRLKPEALVEDFKASDLVREVLEKVEVPK